MAFYFFIVVIMTNISILLYNSVSRQVNMGDPVASKSSLFSTHSQSARLMSACTGSFCFPTPIKSSDSPEIKKMTRDVSYSQTAQLMAACTGSFVMPSGAAHPRSSEGDGSCPRKKTESTGFIAKLVSSSLGGATGAVICYPFEGLKKRLQSGQIASVLESAKTARNSKSALHPAELYRGVTAFATSVTLATTSAMLFNKIIKESPYYHKDSSFHECGSAIMSGMLGAVVGSTPVENIILVQQLRKTSPLGAIKYMLQQGVTRPWVGLRELMMRESGFAFVMLYGAGAAQKAVFERTQDGTLAFIATLGMGLAGATCTQPFDTLATMRQRTDGAISLRSAITSLLAQKGIAGMFRGLSQRALLFTGCSLIIPKVEAGISGVFSERMA